MLQEAKNFLKYLIDSSQFEALYWTVFALLLEIIWNILQILFFEIIKDLFPFCHVSIKGLFELLNGSTELLQLSDFLQILSWQVVFSPFDDVMGCQGDQVSGYPQVVRCIGHPQLVRLFVPTEKLRKVGFEQTRVALPEGR